MAKLYRYVKLNDRFDTQVFTFLLPTRLVKEQYSQDIYSKDFTYGHQKWTVSFMKGEKHLGSYLKLRTVAGGMTCKLDYSFTMVNKDHFTKNESFIETGCDFTIQNCIHGRKTFICLNELAVRNFMQENGEFLVELEMRNIITSFECLLALPKDNHLKPGYNNHIESTYFSFGLDDWGVSLYPFGDSGETEGKAVVHLHRHTSFDHLSHLRYQIFLGEEYEYDSNVLEETFDISGSGLGYVVGAPLYEVTRGRSKIKIRVNMLSVTAVSEVVLEPITHGRNRAHFYDRDKQAWLIESDLNGQTLSFRLYYTDISHVPRKFARYVCWNINSVLPSGAKFKMGKGPHSKYFVQQDLDEGFVVNTAIPVKEVGRSIQVNLLTPGGRLEISPPPSSPYGTLPRWSARLYLDVAHY